MQTLQSRLAQTDHQCKPWPAEPVVVCLLITTLNIGGAEKALVNLALGLSKSHWKVHVINLGGEEPLALELRNHQVEVHCLGVSKRKPLKALKKLAALLRSIRPQILQCFMFHANVSGRLAAWAAGVPWVLGGLRVAEHQKGWHLTVDRLTNSLSLGSVCVSEGVRKFSITYGGLNESRLTVIPNGIEVALIDNAKLLDRSTFGLGTTGQCALFIGRLDPQKGLPWLMDAAEIVASKKPDWRLLMVGHEGSESEWFHDRVATSPLLSRHVQWLGFRNDIPALLKTADVLLLPSLWEGMPNVVLEAMAARLAVIGTAVEGTSELVLPGQTGWLVQPADSQGLASAILESADKPELTRKYGLAGRARVEKHYTLHKTILAYQQLWARILGFTFVQK